MKHRSMNKSRDLKKIPVKKTVDQGIKSISRETDAYYFLVFFFVLAFSYFNWFAGYLLFFQEQQSLFMFSGQFIHDFLVKPGGILDMSGKFLTQFYINKFPGSLILAATLTLPGIVLLHINRKLKPGAWISPVLLLIPPVLLLLMQTHYFHLMVYNLGFLLVLLYFLISILPAKKLFRYLALALFPLFWYLAGAYALIFLGLYIIYSLSNDKGSERFLYSLFLVTLAFISYTLFKEVLFLQPPDKLLRFPLPFISNQGHRTIFMLAAAFIIVYPLLCRLTGTIKPGRYIKRPFTIGAAAVVFSLAVILLIKGYNTQTARVINLERLAFQGKWEEAAVYQEKYPSENQIGQYFYNIALNETGQLCDRLFSGRQDFGTGSLFLPWSNELLNWGAYSFYSIGLANEAHRWAYEEMVVYGCRPQNIMLLIKTNLINGNYNIAAKYIGMLKNTIFYRDIASEYEKINGDSIKIRSHPELGMKAAIQPLNSFFVFLESPESNLPLLVDGNPRNKQAFEYLTAWLLLEKNVDIAVSNIRMMREMGYTRIPRHIEEAVMIYYNTQGAFPDLGGLTVSSETMERFGQYFSAFTGARQNPSRLKQTMEQNFGDTFWYYFHFK